MSKSESRPQNKHLKPFKKWEVVQPDPKLKSQWRERKKQAQIIMDKMLKYSEMTVEQLEDEIKNKGKKMSVQDYLITKYVTSGTKSEKMLVDWMDRHIAKAPTQIEMDSKNTLELGELTKAQLEAIKSLSGL